MKKARLRSRADARRIVVARLPAEHTAPDEGDDDDDRRGAEKAGDDAVADATGTLDSGLTQHRETSVRVVG